MLPNEPRKRKGAIAIVVAISLAAVAMTGSLVVDVGYQRLSGLQLQSALDAAAIAGASRLSTSPAAARSAAIAVAAMNYAGGRQVQVNASEIQIGTYNTSTGIFTPLSGSAESSGTTLRIVKNMSTVRTFLSEIVGVHHLSVSRQATAGSVGSGASVCGVVANILADINGNWSIDSYDSSAGAYSTSTAGQQGSVCSNGDITASGNARVFGDLRYGRDAGDTVSMQGSFSLTGQATPLPAEINFPTVSSTYYATHNNNASIPKTSKNKSVWDGTKFDMNSTATVTIPAGTYYATGFSLNGQARANISGKVIFYVDGDFHANGGGIVNTSQNPANLTVYVSGAHSVELNGNSDFYGSVIAPLSESHINGNNDTYGFLLTKNVELNGNGRMHADLAMLQTFVGNIASNRRVALLR